MARKGSNISILQFGPSFISLLRVKPGAADLRVTASAVRRGDWSAEDGSLSKAIAELVRAHKASNDRLFTVLPRHEATLRELELPSQSDEEIDGMVRLGAEDIVPFPLDQLVTGHRILDRLPSGSSKVLAVVVQRRIVDEHLELLRAADLAPEQIFLSTDCLIAAASESKSTGTQAFIDLSPGGIEILVLSEGRFVFGRGIATEELWVEPVLGESAREELVSEVQASLGTYARELGDGGPVDTICVSSGCADAAGIAAAMGDAFELPCVVASQVADVVRPGSEALQYVPLAALGAALSAQRTDRHYAGLLPRLEMQRREAATSRLRFARLAAMLALVVFALGGVFGLAVKQRTEYMAELDGRAELLRPLARSVGTKRRQLKMLQNQVAHDTTVLQFLGSIVGLAPKEGLNFTRITYDRAKGIELRGRALEPKAFDKLIDDLRGTGAGTLSEFAQAQEIYRIRSRERGRRTWDFAITIPFSLDEEAGDE